MRGAEVWGRRGGGGGGNLIRLDFLPLFFPFFANSLRLQITIGKLSLLLLHYYGSLLLFNQGFGPNFGPIVALLLEIDCVGRDSESKL